MKIAGPWTRLEQEKKMKNATCPPSGAAPLVPGNHRAQHCRALSQRGVSPTYKCEIAYAGTNVINQQFVKIVETQNQTAHSWPYPNENQQQKNQLLRNSSSAISKILAILLFVCKVSRFSREIPLTSFKFRRIFGTERKNHRNLLQVFKTFAAKLQLSAYIF